MKKTKTVAFSNLIFSIIFLGVGIAAYIASTHFQEVKGTYAQPAAFPQIMIWGLIIFAAALFVQSVVALLIKMKETNPLAEETESVNFIKNKYVAAALICIVLCILYVALFKTLGYVIDSFIICMILMYMIGKRKWVQMALISFLIPLVMWALFYIVLTVNVPMGPLKFLCDLADML